jgi:hypothetical protein
MSSDSITSAQRLSPQQDSANTYPSELIPIILPQPSTIGVTQSLQARILQEQLNAFTSQTSIKCDNQVLFQPRAADNIHIITATDDMVPKVRVTSWGLLLETQLFLTSQSGNVDADIHKYIPADHLLPTLAQMRRSRPHLKTKIALIESQLVYTCFHVLATAHAYPTLSFRDHHQQYCRIRLAIASYTSSIILSKHQDTSEQKARLHSWKYIEVDDKFLLTLETDEPTRVLKLVQGRVQKSAQGVSIYFENGEEEVVLSFLKDEAHLLRQIHLSIHSNQETEADNDQGQKELVSNSPTYFLIWMLC